MPEENCGYCESKGLIVQDKMERMQRRYKGKLSEAAVVFNRTVKYEDPSVRQTVATLICLYLSFMY